MIREYLLNKIYKEHLKVAGDNENILSDEIIKKLLLINEENLEYFDFNELIKAKEVAENSAENIKKISTANTADLIALDYIITNSQLIERNTAQTVRLGYIAGFLEEKNSKHTKAVIKSIYHKKKSVYDKTMHEKILEATKLDLLYWDVFGYCKLPSNETILINLMSNTSAMNVSQLLVLKSAIDMKNQSPREREAAQNKVIESYLGKEESNSNVYSILDSQIKEKEEKAKEKEAKEIESQNIYSKLKKELSGDEKGLSEFLKLLSDKAPTLSSKILNLDGNDKSDFIKRAYSIKEYVYEQIATKEKIYAEKSEKHAGFELNLFKVLNNEDSVKNLKVKNRLKLLGLEGSEIEQDLVKFENAVKLIEGPNKSADVIENFNQAFLELVKKNQNNKEDVIKYVQVNYPQEYFIKELHDSYIVAGHYDEQFFLNFVNEQLPYKTYLLKYEIFNELDELAKKTVSDSNKEKYFKDIFNNAKKIIEETPALSFLYKNMGNIHDVVNKNRNGFVKKADKDGGVEPGYIVYHGGKTHVIKGTYKERKGFFSNRVGPSAKNYESANRVKTSSFPRITKWVMSLRRFMPGNTKNDKNADAVLECLANDIASEFFSCQKQQLLRGEYSDGTPQYALMAEWETGLDELNISKNVKESRIKLFRKTLYTDTCFINKEDPNNALSIPGAGKSLALFLSQGDRDALGSRGDNKKMKDGKLFGIDFGHAYRKKSEILDAFNDDFTFKSNSGILNKFKNFSALTDNSLLEKMTGLKEYLDEHDEKIMKKFDRYIKIHEELKKKATVELEENKKNGDRKHNKKLAKQIETYQVIIDKLEESKRYEQEAFFKMVDKFKNRMYLVETPAETKSRVSKVIQQMGNAKEYQGIKKNLEDFNEKLKVESTSKEAKGENVGQLKEAKNSREKELAKHEERGNICNIVDALEVLGSQDATMQVNGINLTYPKVHDRARVEFIEKDGEFTFSYQEKQNIKIIDYFNKLGLEYEGGNDNQQFSVKAEHLHLLAKALNINVVKKHIKKNDSQVYVNNEIEVDESVFADIHADILKDYDVQLKGGVFVIEEPSDEQKTIFNLKEKMRFVEFDRLKKITPFLPCHKFLKKELEKLDVEVKFTYDFSNLDKPITVDLQNVYSDSLIDFLNKSLAGTRGTDLFINNETTLKGLREQFSEENIDKLKKDMEAEKTSLKQYTDLSAVDVKKQQDEIIKFLNDFIAAKNNAEKFKGGSLNLDKTKTPQGSELHGVMEEINSKVEKYNSKLDKIQKLIELLKANNRAAYKNTIINNVIGANKLDPLLSKISKMKLISFAKYRAKLEEDKDVPSVLKEDKDVPSVSKKDKDVTVIKTKKEVSFGPGLDSHTEQARNERMQAKTIYMARKYFDELKAINKNEKITDPQRTCLVDLFGEEIIQKIENQQEMQKKIDEAMEVLFKQDENLHAEFISLLDKHSDHDANKLLEIFVKIENFNDKKSFITKLEQKINRQTTSGKIKSALSTPTGHSREPSSWVGIDPDFVGKMQTVLDNVIFTGEIKYTHSKNQHTENNNENIEKMEYKAKGFTISMCPTSSLTKKAMPEQPKQYSHKVEKDSVTMTLSITGDNYKTNGLKALAELLYHSFENKNIKKENFKKCITASDKNDIETMLEHIESLQTKATSANIIRP